MQMVLTLIAAPGSHVLEGATVEAAAETLKSLDARIGAPDWLADGEACDLPFEAESAEGAEAAFRNRLGEATLDFAVQPARARRKKLLLADMDSTMVTAETLDELAAFAGLKQEIAAITARAMAGELDFEGALRTRVGLLAELPLDAIEQTRDAIELTPGARTLVQTMKANGAYAALISGGFTQFTHHVRHACGFDEDRANSLVIADGKLTGEVGEPILGRDSKRRALEELIADLGMSVEHACTVGDGANDIDMLRAAGLGVAFRAKPKVREAAPFRIDHGDLTALLYLQGYRKQDFVH